MPDTRDRDELDKMAGEIFELIKLASTARARARAGAPEVLSETEFLALDVLTQNKSLTVGDVQKRIGVVPAQMSRIIRSLENKGGDAFVTCSINSGDRRKVDVRIAPRGREAHDAYRSLRLGFAMEILRSLAPDDRRRFMGYLGQIHEGISQRLNSQ